MIIHSAKDLAIAIKSQRKKKQLNQTTVADSVGLKQTTISAFESSPDKSQIDTLFRILSALSLDLEINEKVKSLNDEW